RRAGDRTNLYEERQEALYKEAQQLAPGVVPVEYFFSRRYVEALMTKAAAAQDPPARESFLREAASDLSTASANMELAALLDRQGRRDEAIIQVRQAIQKAPRSADSYVA